MSFQQGNFYYTCKSAHLEETDSVRGVPLTAIPPSSVSAHTSHLSLAICLTSKAYWLVAVKRAYIAILNLLNLCVLALGLYRPS